MSADEKSLPQGADGVSDDALKKAEEYVEAEEGVTNRLAGWLGGFVAVVAIVMSLFHMYAAMSIFQAHVQRGIHVAFVLFLVFLLFPLARRFRHRVTWWDWLQAFAALAVMGYMLMGGDAFLERSTNPTALDTFCGILLMALVLEGARRTSGWIMPAIVVLFLIYALIGAKLPPPWTHQGMDVARVVGHMYMTLEGIFGTPIEVSSSLIILFTIYGAFLQYSGAGKFFLDFSFAAMGGRPAGAGRTIVLASFLLGGPSGSGVATTVTLGSVAYPMMVKAGYGRDAAGGLLAAGGLGAIISPPVLGAAAFLIAEFLRISYLDVLLMATIPTILFYFALFLMVEIDARKFGMKRVRIDKADTMLGLTRRFGFHFLSLVAIITFMLLGFSPLASVFWATVTAFVVSFLHPDCALIPHDVLLGRGPILHQLRHSGLRKALEGGSIGVLNVAATCAAAGLIVGVVTLTGLGLKFSSIVLGYADALTGLVTSALSAVGVAITKTLIHDVRLLWTAIFTSLIVWIVGLAVPVTASYIICAVIAAPALIKLDVAPFAAHMFIFYYAVLSEVSPPTALSPFAAAAITGGDPYRTTLQSWKYTMPAFLVPFMFVLDPAGLGLLLQGSFKALAQASFVDIARVCVTAMIGIAALAGGMQAWVFRRTTRIERWLLVIAGLALVYPRAMFDYIGIVLITVVLISQKVRRNEPSTV